MSEAWIRAKLPEFVRNLFRNFCQACHELEGQFQLFDENGNVEFAVLQNLLGNEMDKGLLWRMKDTAHHVFRNDPDEILAGQFLDWAMGYIFHETLKLKEDAYQKQTYAPWFHKITDSESTDADRAMGRELIQILNQTEESMSREIERIRFIMDKCRQLLPAYLTRYRDNVLLARFIFSQNDLVCEVFGADYDQLIAALYGNETERMYVLASQSLRRGGWIKEASEALEQAFRLSPSSRLVLQEKKIIDNWARRIQA